jgi:3-phenylpropionate/trans-cinnamate dioxygenase ferredoxin subunit
MLDYATDDRPSRLLCQPGTLWSDTPTQRLTCGLSWCKVLRSSMIVAPNATRRSISGRPSCDDTCTHQDASLADGWVENCAVECPLHEACFDLRTGVPSGAPAKTPVRTYAVHVDDGSIVLDLPSS